MLRADHTGACNLSTPEVEGGGLQVPCQHGLDSVTNVPNRKVKKKKTVKHTETSTIPNMCVLKKKKNQKRVRQAQVS